MPEEMLPLAVHLADGMSGVQLRAAQLEGCVVGLRRQPPCRSQAFSSTSMLTFDTCGLLPSR